MTHPSAIDLEAFACGDALAHVAAHVGGCTACRSFVDRAEKAAATPAPVDVAPVLALARRREAKRRWLLASSVAAPLAVAAAALLFVRPAAHDAPVAALDPPAPSEQTGERLLTAPFHRDPDTTFKGGLQLAVVRERAGAQARFTEGFRVRPGDRLRIEVALDRPVAIVGGVMGDDGSWVELMPEGVRDSGTFFSEKSVSIDAQPTSGTILVGPPDAVLAARTSHGIAGVRAIHVEWEAGGRP
jgi:hypothetical protein